MPPVVSTAAPTVCPSCRADLRDSADMRDSEVERTGVRECPFCGADLGEIEVTSGGEGSAHRAGAGLPPLPAKSRTAVVDSSTEGLVLAIDAAGWRASSIIFFAVLWNGVSWTVGIVFTFVGAKEMGAEALFPVGMSLLFIGIGAGLAVWAVRAAFERTLVLIEKDRAAVQKILFGRRTTKSASLRPDSVARLEEAYKQNDVPVHRVVVTGDGDRLSFGTPLSAEEKTWLVNSINARIAPQLPTELPGKNDSLRELAEQGRNAAPLAPSELPADSPVSLEEEMDRIRVSVAAVPGGIARTVSAAAVSAPLFGTLAMIGLWSRDLFGGNGPGVLGILRLLPAMAFLAALVAALSFVFRGRVTTTVDAEGVSVRWHLGRFGKSVAVPLDAVQKVTVGPENRSETFGSHVAVVVARREVLPMTTFHDVRTDREVAGLVRWQLERLGRRLADD